MTNLKIWNCPFYSDFEYKIVISKFKTAILINNNLFVARHKIYYTTLKRSSVKNVMPESPFAWLLSQEAPLLQVAQCHVKTQVVWSLLPMIFFIYLSFFTIFSPHIYGCNTCIIIIDKLLYIKSFQFSIVNFLYISTSYAKTFCQ